MFAPGIGWMAEGELDQTEDDFLEYFFVFGRKTEDQDIGFYLSYNSQDHYRAPAAPDAGLTGAESGFWVFDLFAKQDFSLVNVATELTLFSGKLVGKDLLAINAVAQLNWKLGKFDLLTEGGFSSGTDDRDINSNNIKTVPFSRDYDVGLILFEEAVPGGRNSFTTAGIADNTPTAPHSGAVSNAAYARVKVGYPVADFFHPSLNLIVPFAAQLGAPGTGGRFYGVEYDLITKWPITKHITADFSFEHFIPGSFYDKVSKSHSGPVGTRRNRSEILRRGSGCHRFLKDFNTKIIFCVSMGSA